MIAIFNEVSSRRKKPPRPMAEISIGKRPGTQLLGGLEHAVTVHQNMAPGRCSSGPWTRRMDGIRPMSSGPAPLSVDECRIRPVVAIRRSRRGRPRRDRSARWGRLKVAATSTYQYKLLVEPASLYAIVYMSAVVSGSSGGCCAARPDRARRPSPMRPAACAQVILGREILWADASQVTVALPLVLEFQGGRQIAVHVFVDAADGVRPILDVIARRPSESPFVRDVGSR